MADLPESPDLGAFYRAARLSFIETFDSLPAATLEKKLPACQKWTPKDLLGHASGTIDDVTNGRLEGAGGDAWTDAQVKAAKDMSAADLIARWNEQSPNVETLLTNSPPSMLTNRLIIDMVTHIWDLAGLGGPKPPQDEAFKFALSGYASAFGYRIKKAEMPAVQLHSGDWTFAAGVGDPDMTVEADAVEFFRGLSGRRSIRQVLGWDWEGEPGPYIDLVSNFGELAQMDVNEVYGSTA